MEDFKYKDLPIFFRYRILWHVVFWVVVYVIHVITYGSYWEGNYYYEAIINLELFPVRMFYTYLMIYYIIPNFLITRRYKIFFVGTFIHAFLFGFTLWLFLYYLADFPDYHCYRSYYPVFYIPKILTVTISNYAIPLSAVFVKLFKWWYIDQQDKYKLRKEKLTSELNYLKSQIHPHFLFNTLNNLYALTLQKSEKASDVVIKLSNLLDYMLYQAGNDRISLEKELEIIKSYIELEKIRYGDRLDLKFEIEGETTNVQIAPLVLFPFIENAFKHGASNDSKRPYINVLVKLNPGLLELEVKNSLPEASKPQIGNSEGIGLKNVCRRLHLIYPELHELILKPEKDKFYIHLTINLT